MKDKDDNTITEYERKRADGRVGYDGRDFEYCPYTETSKRYDETRKPLGLHIYLGALAVNEIPLDQQTLLDVGCGTGTFLASVKDKLRAVEGVEYNDGMIAQARMTLGDSATLVQGSADDLPQQDRSMDAVTINQVIHHFAVDNSYAFLKRFIGHVYRVLKPGGVFVINTSSPEQVTKGFWWSALMPKAMEDIVPRYPPVSTIIQILVEAGFHCFPDSVIVLSQATLMTREAYAIGLDGAFQQSYRDGDSFWSVAEQKGEVESIQNKIHEMRQNGTDKEWWATREDIRRHTGQVTFIICHKSKDESH